MAKITLAAELENLELMIKFIRNGAEKHGFSSKDMNRIQLASEEVLVNIISYAYSDKNGDIEITYNMEEGRGLVMKITDWGGPFDPLLLPEPDVEASVEDREMGGLGVFIMRNIMDEVDYERTGDRNILTLVKH
jgi:anti-sigma regulatory factor (Ser/Thr protein kinase)